MVNIALTYLLVQYRIWLNDHVAWTLHRYNVCFARYKRKKYMQTLALQGTVH